MTPKLAANLLRLSGWGFMIFCTVFVTIAFTGYDGLAHSIADLFDWTGPPHDEPLTRDARWFGAIWSGLGAGFGALYVFLVAPLLTVPDIKTRQIARRGGLIGAFAWFIVDSVGSYASGVPSNVVMNALFLIAVAAPLLLVKLDR